MVSRPQTREELFNLWHAALHNIIKRIFGIVKHRLCVLQYPPNIPCTSRHSFHSRSAPFTICPGLGNGPADAAERRHADQCRDDIAHEMWIDYQGELRCRTL